MMYITATAFIDDQKGGFLFENVSHWNTFDTGINVWMKSGNCMSFELDNDNFQKLIKALVKYTLEE